MIRYKERGSLLHSGRRSVVAKWIHDDDDDDDDVCFTQGSDDLASFLISRACRSDSLANYFYW